jgi:hypothetical protein
MAASELVGGVAIEWMASQIDVIEIQVARKHDAHVGWPEEEKVK